MQDFRNDAVRDLCVEACLGEGFDDGGEEGDDSEGGATEITEGTTPLFLSLSTCSSSLLASGMGRFLDTLSEATRAAISLLLGRMAARFKETRRETGLPREASKAVLEWMGELVEALFQRVPTSSGAADDDRLEGAVDRDKGHGYAIVAPKKLCGSVERESRWRSSNNPPQSLRPLNPLPTRSRPSHSPVSPECLTLHTAAMARRPDSRRQQWRSRRGGQAFASGIGRTAHRERRGGRKPSHLHHHLRTRKGRRRSGISLRREERQRRRTTRTTNTEEKRNGRALRGNGMKHGRTATAVDDSTTRRRRRRPSEWQQRCPR